MAPDEQPLHRQFLRQFTTHESAIRAFVRRLVPSRADADDIMQEASIVLWEKFGDFRPEGDFRAWAFGVARFEVLAWRRDKARDRILLDENVVEKLAAESADDESHLSRHREALQQCMEQVKPDQRGLLMEAYDSDKRIHEVATRSGRSEAGFYQWLHRMRSKLLDCIRRNLNTGGVAK